MQIACMPFLAQGKYLLGFSGGADSLALFFLLLESHVEFDIAIVDYGVRPESVEEIVSAHTLAKSHHKRCFSVKSPTFASNFEANARDFRYKFFSSLIATHGYDGLILAHHLNDRIEWLLLRLGKGSGLAGLLGFDEIGWYYPTHAAPYPIIRPLLWARKEEILAYCDQNSLQFFTDSSNNDTAYERNFIRHHFANVFIKRYHKGLQESLKLLAAERDELYQGGFRIVAAHLEPTQPSSPPYSTTPLKHIKSPKQPGSSTLPPPKESIDSGARLICVSAFSKFQALHHIATALKTCGYVLSRKQREEILRAHFSCEFRTSVRAFYIEPCPAALCVELSAADSAALESSVAESSTPSLRILIIAQNLLPTEVPGLTLPPSQPMPKHIKELCRKHAVPPRLRPILYGISMRECAGAERSLACAVEEILARIGQEFIALESSARGNPVR